MRVGIVRIDICVPVPHTLVARRCAGAKAVGVLEKDVSFGARGHGVHKREFCAAAGRRRSPYPYNFIGGLGGDDISEAQVAGIFRVLQQAAEGADVPRVSFLGIDSPADVLGAEGGR